MEDIRKVTFNCLKNQIKNSEELSRMTDEYPSTKDMIGAIKGVIALYYAYKFSINKAVEGKLHYITHQGDKKQFQAYEKLSIIDLEQFAQTCFDKGDYALSIEFVRNILILLPKLKESKVLNGLSKRINNMKENLIKLNNGYLEKHQTFISKNYIVLPYFVDKKLRKKKKQPIFIDNETFNTNLGVECDNRSEREFMESCQLDILGMMSQKHKGYLCRYLHHNNPYLKLGPFKEEMNAHIPYSVVFHDILTETEMSKFILQNRNSSNSMLMI